jgi:hypothetical protein
MLSNSILLIPEYESMVPVTAIFSPFRHAGRPLGGIGKASMAISYAWQLISSLLRTLTFAGADGVVLPLSGVDFPDELLLDFGTDLLMSEALALFDTDVLRLPFGSPKKAAAPPTIYIFKYIVGACK